MAAGLKGTVALVTGTSSRIGEATARSWPRGSCGRARRPPLGSAHGAGRADEPREVADLISVSSLSGRIVGKGCAVYNATKHAMNAYSESPRQEVAGRRVRVSALEPAAVATELFPPEVRRRHRAEHGACEGLRSEDVADAIGYIVTRPRHVVVGELLVRPTAQERSP